ncbi:hypothetical protein Tco_0569820 [Tanacetum coccineum]
MYEGLKAEMDFRSFMVEGIDGEFHFRPKGGFADGEGNYPSNKSVNNEATIIDVAPLNSAPPSHVADNITTGKRKLATGPSSKDVRNKLRKVPLQASKVAGDASDSLDVERDPDIHEIVIVTRAVKDLDLKMRDSVANPKTQLLQDIDSLKHDQAIVVSKVVLDVATKLIRSDEMGCLITKLVKAFVGFGGTSGLVKILEVAF